MPIKLKNALYCENCQTIYSAQKHTQCPVCTDVNAISLWRWFNRKPERDEDGCSCGIRPTQHRVQKGTCLQCHKPIFVWEYQPDTGMEP